MKLVIDRSKWLRGEKNGGLLLRESDGKMCCLGFYSLACGLTEDQILGLGEPHETVAHGAPHLLPEWLCTSYEEHDDEGALVTKLIDTDEAMALMEMNDHPETEDGFAETREAEIARIFAKHGVEVEFIDGEQS